MEKVLITGGTGTIGKVLAKKLSQKGYEINILSRKTNKLAPYNQYTWSVNENLIEETALENVDYIIHLAGTNISDKRWSKTQKSAIETSRINSTKLIFNTCRRINSWPKAFISSSAIGYYGTFNSEQILNETSEPGKDYLANVCVNWEKASELFAEMKVRTVLIRTGVVLDKSNGAYQKISKPAKLGLASVLGKGNQFVPWIHIDDIVNIYIKAIEDDKMVGPYNGVAPQHITNKELTKEIAGSLKKPMFLPNIPSLIIKMAYGQMSDILLKGSRISSHKLQEAGFRFIYENIKEALAQLAKVK